MTGPTQRQLRALLRTARKPLEVDLWALVFFCTTALLAFFLAGFGIGQWLTRWA